jgi:acyl-coenzyme A thioesterase PaaI-like protein
MDAVFQPDGDGRFVPTEHARGPWDPMQLHGGAPAALLARAAERAGEPEGLGVVRLTVEFLSAVPLAPVEVAAEVVRPGRRLQLVEARLRAGGREVLRARAVRLRREPGAAADLDPAPPRVPPPPVTGAPPPGWGPEEAGFHRTAMELRVVAGDVTAGAATVWFRPRMALVAGEAPTGLQRAVAAADFGNGVAQALPFATHLFVNTDLTVHLRRPPAGEWVALDARTRVEGDGVGLADSVLHDERGPIGLAAQSLYVAPRRQD